jgi:hypothetical protein
MWVSTVFGLSQSARQMPWFDCHQSYDLSLTPRQLGHGINPTAPGEQFVDNRSVDDALTGGDPLHGVDEVFDATDTFFHQVADPFRPLFDKSERIGGLEVLGKHENCSFRITRTDLARRTQPLVRVGRRHADVDESHIWTRVANAGKERRSRAESATRPGRSIDRLSGDTPRQDVYPVLPPGPQGLRAL